MLPVTVIGAEFVPREKHVALVFAQFNETLLFYFIQSVKVRNFQKRIRRMIVSTVRREVTDSWRRLPKYVVKQRRNYIFIYIYMYVCDTKYCTVN